MRCTALVGAPLLTTGGPISMSLGALPRGADHINGPSIRARTVTGIARQIVEPGVRGDTGGARGEGGGGRQTVESGCGTRRGSHRVRSGRRERRRRHIGCIFNTKYESENATFKLRIIFRLEVTYICVSFERVLL